MPHNVPRDGRQTRKGGRYDRDHQLARAAAAQRHCPTDPCARCRHPLGPMGPWLHYDHAEDGLSYLGFSHGSHPCHVCGRRCNIHAAAVKGNRLSRGLRRRLAL